MIKRKVMATAFVSCALTTEAYATCLEEAAAFATKICGEISKKGRSQLTTASGELNAETKGIIRRVIGTAGGEMRADTRIETYENVIHSQLGPELIDARKCGAAMATAAMNQVCTKPVSLRRCRHPDFGQEGWARSETLQGSTGWRDGGYNPDAYCSDYITAVINSRQLGGKPYKIDIVNKREEGKWTGTFGRTRKYNYHCGVNLLWEPIYNERIDERCGVDPK